MIALFAAAALADVCAEARGAARVVPPDPEDAARYVQVGDDARAAGDERTAVIAYGRAIALDPGAHAAADALAALCADATLDDAARLVAAIAQYRAGELDDAEHALRAIATGGAASGAHFFLGMIALAHHDSTEAQRELAVAARDPAYAAAAREALVLARRDGGMSAVVLVAPEYDTNPQLLPDTPPAGATTGAAMPDADLLVAATVAIHPAPWLFLRDELTWREQLEQDALDFFGDRAQLGVEFGGRNRFAIRYELDYDVLQDARYLIANGGGIAYRRELDATAIVASYAVRHRDFQQAAQASFIGWVQNADAGAVVHAAPRVDLDVRATFVREGTADPAFADVAFGVAAALRARLRAGLRLAGYATGWYASYDGYEPDGSLRRDDHGELGADVEYDLGDHVIATCGGSFAVNRSTVADFDYVKAVARCGVAIAVGGP